MASNIVLQGTTLHQNKLPFNVSKPIFKLNGTFSGQRAFFCVDNDILSKHSLFVGGTGCGKSNLIYQFVKQIKANMTEHDVMIIFDSKGDFHEKFPPKKNFDVVIGNSPKYRNDLTRWNLFKEVLADGWDDSNVIVNAQEICKAFFEEQVAKDNSNPFFPNAARDVLASLIIALIRQGNYSDNSKKQKFARQFFGNDVLKSIIDEYSPKELVDEICGSHTDMAKVKTYIGGAGKQAEGVLAVMYSVIGDIFRGVFNERGQFSVRNFVREKGAKTLYIEYDLATGSVLGPVYTLLFDLALKEALGRVADSGNKAINGNVYLIADELKLLPRLQHMDDGINFGRSLGVKILAGLQSIEQLNADYGEDDAKNIISGFSSIYAFRANDPKTRGYVRDLFGENIVVERWQGADKILKDGVPRKGYTVEDWNLTTLKVGEAVVGLPFMPPFQFQFDEYSG